MLWLSSSFTSFSASFALAASFSSASFSSLEVLLALIISSEREAHGRLPKISSTSSAKITSLSINSWASLLCPSLLSDSIFLARSYCSFTIRFTSSSIGERFSRKAGQVEHLCTPISLKVGSANGRLAEILSVLHPTPAVGGYPKELAMEWIRRVEPHERRYYGGYLGPMFGEHVRLFVNLRCMEVDDSRLRLYVGGGLTDKSDPESEWKETEAKAQTLLSIINGYK